MTKVSTISITPTTRTFTVPTGSSGAIITSGSGTWTAAVSDPWITLAATKGTAGTACAYQVTANTNVEQRIGYVYVAGYTHTITQAGQGGSIGSTNTEFEKDGGTGTVTVSAADKMVWHAQPNVDWLSVSPTIGAGNGKVTFQVAPWHEVTTRSGTLTIAGQTFTVFQYGKRIEIDPASTSCDYQAHVVPITVNALASQSWSVVPKNSWLSVVDAGTGKGAGMTSIAIAENPSYKARFGTVKVGTETFSVTQAGRTALEFAVSPASTTAGVTGANGLVGVTATPDLPWTATTTANWLTLYNATGSGNGNVVFVASPNSTLYQRKGTITVTPEKASGVAAKTVTVTQPARVSSISSTGYEFAAAGESMSVDVTVDKIVEWKVESSLSWVSITTGTSYVGPGTVTIQASPNDTVYSRSGTIKIANKTFTITQLGRGVKLSYDNIVFDTDGQPKNGGVASFSVEPDGNVSWTAVASDPTWIILFGETSGTGKAEITYVIAPYYGDGTARTGTITVGDQKVYITQRAYDLTINPNGKTVTGNSGAGEVGVSAPIGDVWTAIVTAPWITVVSGYDAGTGSGTVRFTYTENNTGKTRSGKIVIAGEAYTLVQAARVSVAIRAEAGHGGSVSGGGSYTLGERAILTAHPADGYQFAYWEGDVSSMQNPITVTADVAKSVKAVFTPLTPEFVSVSNATDGVTLVWTNLAWATEYNIYRAPSSTRTGGPLATLVADGTHSYFDATGDVGVPYWYWVEAVGAVDTNECVNPVSGKKLKPIVISSITYENLRGTTHTNPATYQEETVVAFTPPSGIVTGYTFAGWTPNGITTEMTGDQTVTANWTANSYEVQFHANGGSGTMANQAFVYDVAQALTACGFARDGYGFLGWGRGEDAASTVADAQIVSNLTDVAGGVVELWAVWKSTGGGDDPGVIHTPPEWTGVTKSDTMAVYATVLNKKTGANVETDGSLLAAFDSTGECRGVAEIEEGPLGMLFQLSVGINSTSETGFTLKVWDAATGEITEIAETFDANADKQLGAIFEPIGYEIGALTQEVSLGEGWSWISFCLTPEDAKVGTLFGGLTFANGDMLKAADKLVTYYNGVWYPSAYALKPGAAYMVKKTDGGTEAVTVEGSLMTDGLALSAGWNWFGPATLATQTISAVTYTGGFANNDQAKSSSKVATWYGGKWYSSDFQLCPGAGYVAKLTNAGTLYFDAAPSLASAPLMAAAPLVLSAAPSSKPTWTPVVKSDTMAVYATIHDTTTDADIVAEGSILAAFDTEGECRGVATIEDGPIGKVFQLPIGLESTSETGFVLKVWDASNGTIYEVVETVDANAEKQIGQIFEPTVFTVKSEGDPIPDLGENPTTEEITNVFVEAKAEDPRLAEKITTEAAYTNFSAWAKKVQPQGGGDAVGAVGVMAAPNAWVSYALGSETLLETAPTDADLTVEEFEPKSGEDGKFDFTVSVEGVEVGGAATTEAQMEQVKENLKQVFGLEGGTTPNGLSTANVDITFGTPVDGKVKFTAGPKDTSAQTFFMKVIMTP